jgi:hypothetical protein
MDKDRLKKIVETSLGSHFGDDLSINDMVVLPTQKFDEKTNEWVPDSYSLFIQIHKGSVILNRPGETESFLESLLGFECCVDFV